MFVTMDGKTPWARPMSTIVRPDERRIYLLTDRKTAKDDDVKANPNVLLGYVNSPTFLTVRGTAELTEERSLIKDLWSPGAQVFWPSGPEDPDVVAIIVSPHEAEYWDGDNRLISTVKFAWALATGSRLSAGESKKLELSHADEAPLAHDISKGQPKLKSSTAMKKPVKKLKRTSNDRVAAS